VLGLWSMQYGTWLRRIVVAVGFTVVAFVLFAFVLGVPLPAGPVENLLIEIGVINP
jgi:hypothetical protein